LTLTLFSKTPLRCSLITRLLAGPVLFLVGGCRDPEGTSEFAPVYVAAAYGTVTAAGAPAADVSIRAHVYRSACELEPRFHTSESFAQTDMMGFYAVSLYSNDSTPGQCVVLRRSDTGDSVVVSLAALSFNARSYEEPRDSIQIDLAAD
jgi:hypothetical protein